MAPTTQPAKQHSAVSPATQRDLWRTLNAQDGTQALMRTGGWTLLTCAIAFALVGTVLGGMTPQGPRTLAGWMAVIVALMTLPFGMIVFALGVAKSLRNRHLARRAVLPPRG